MENLLVARFYQMTRSEVPTAADLRCPQCGGAAQYFSSPCAGELAVSLRCQCIEVELDGVQKWEGWEVLSRTADDVSKPKT